MLKRKVGDSSDWDAHKRELICYTIKWQDLPTGARLCWKEEAYARINEAEEVMLEDKFEKWVQGASIRREQRETYWILEDWGADVPRMMKKDRDEVRNRVIKARKDLYLTWCQKVRNLPYTKLNVVSHSAKTRPYNRFFRTPYTEALWMYFRPTPLLPTNRVS